MAPTGPDHASGNAVTWLGKQDSGRRRRRETAAPLALRKAPQISLDSAQDFGQYESAWTTR